MAKTKKIYNPNGGIITKEGKLKKKLKNYELNNFDKILRWFVVPLLKHCPEYMPKGRFLEYLFHIDTRIIDRYVVYRDYNMNDIKLKHNKYYISGLPNVQLEVGDIIYICYDTTKPDKVEMSLCKKNENEKVYKISYDTFKKMLIYIEKANI